MDENRATMWAKIAPHYRATFVDEDRPEDAGGVLKTKEAYSGPKARRPAVGFPRGLASR
jgi:hypothetical protein